MRVAVESMPIVSSIEELVTFIREQMPLGMRILAGFKPAEYQWTNTHGQVLTTGKLAEAARTISTQGVLEGFAPEKHQWTSRHSQIEYQGSIIDIKYPTVAGYAAITLLRPLGERLWNEGYLRYEGPKKSVMREHETLVKLRKQGFPTFESLQHLILDCDGKPLVPRVLLTRFEQEAVNAVDILGEGDRSRSTGVLLEGFALAKRLHEYGVYISDPWWGNFSEVGGDLWHGDYGFLVNPAQDDALVRAREVAQLVISGVYRSDIEAERVAQIARISYDGINELRPALEHIIAYDEQHMSGALTRSFRNLLFQKTVFGMSQEETLKIKKELLRQL